MKILQKLFQRLNSSTAPEVADSEAQAATDYVDARDCGLVDAVQSGWFQNATDELFTGFAISAEDVVLDIGCGAGGATLFCANRGAHVVFTDVIADKIEALTDKLAQTPARAVEGMVSDSLPLPLADDYATRIIALEVLEHVEDPAQVLGELVRVARPGALFLLAVPDPVGEHIQKDCAAPHYFSHPNHIHIFEREAFAELVKGAGLVIERRASYGFFWTMWMLMYWTQQKHSGEHDSGETHDVVHPPYSALVEDWSSLWRRLIDMPEFSPVKQNLDSLMPKSQVIVARKPS
ncbi:methyltransferase domain-containing protein [Pseudomonas sp. NPDC078700]|uniref:class I SAM-dependent methyltransferase n=1 Tax=Pseudomonas sp. NPDC078700 TaxID=3364424 RepID=UPI0037C7604B